MPSYLTFASVQATTKVWNATTGGVPTGWEQPGFDDSAWPLSSVPSTGGPFTLPAGVEPIAPWAVAAANTDNMLYRSTFSVPAAPYAPYLLEYFSSLDGEFLIWLNGHGMLGIGKVNVLSSFAPTPGTTAVIAASAVTGSGFHWPHVLGGGFEAWLGWRMTFYAPDAGGQVYSWGTVTTGDNDMGFLGTGDTATHLTPTPADPALPASIVKVVSNGKTTLFLTADGRLFGCGDNSTGLLAGGATDSSPHPVPFQLLIPRNWPFADISIGDDSVLVVERNQDIRGWGPNVHGSLGGTSPEYTGVILGQVGDRVFMGIDDARYIACGKNFAAYGNSEGQVVTIGENTYGQLGQGTSGSDVTIGGQCGVFGFGSNPRVFKMSAGVDCLLIAADDGTVWGCGRNEFGALDLIVPFLPGTGPSRIVNTPTAIAGGGFSLGTGIDAQLAQADRLSFYKRPLGFTSIPWYGDGEPYGGNAHGSVGSGTGSGNIIAPTGSGPFATIRIAESSGGSQNPSGALNDSHVAYGAILLTQETTDEGAFDSGVTTFGALDTLTLLTVSGIAPPPGTTTLSTVLLAVTITSTHGLGDPTRYNVVLDFYDASHVLISSDVSQFGFISFSASPQSADFTISTGGLPPYTETVVLTADTNGGGPGGANTLRAEVTVTSLSDAFDYGDLYTWGYGGAGQMGSGADPTSNLRPVSLNGLGRVVAATVCEAGMFAIAAAAVAVRRRVSAWAAVIG
jgi:hypothetical protein